MYITFIKKISAIASLKHPQIWQVVNDYLTLLGEETITQMAYCYPEPLEIVEAHRFSTFSLKELLEIPTNQ